MSKIATVMARSKVTVTDLVGLTGISRPTLTKLVKGEGSTWQMKQEAFMDTMRKVAMGVRNKTLPLERIRSETQDMRVARISEALERAARIEKAKVKEPAEEPTSGPTED